VHPHAITFATGSDALVGQEPTDFTTRRYAEASPYDSNTKSQSRFEREPLGAGWAGAERMQALADATDRGITTKNGALEGASGVATSPHIPQSQQQQQQADRCDRAYLRAPQHCLLAHQDGLLAPHDGLLAPQDGLLAYLCPSLTWSRTGKEHTRIPPQTNWPPCVWIP